MHSMLVAGTGTSWTFLSFWRSNLGIKSNCYVRCESSVFFSRECVAVENLDIETLNNARIGTGGGHGRLMFISSRKVTRNSG